MFNIKGHVINMHDEDRGVRCFMKTVETVNWKDHLVCLYDAYVHTCVCFAL